MPRIFVYGTLRRGEANAHRLSAARFVCTARTERRYVLSREGGYPALREGGDSAVAGEIFEVDEETLAHIDEFEGHPDLYRRAPIALEGGHEADGYLYVG